MTAAHVIYGVWAFVAVASALLWLVAARRWRLGGHRVGRPAVLLRALFSHGALRMVALVGWLWLGWHLFAR